MDLLLNNLLTEERNPASMDIDLLSTEGILRVINQEDQKVPLAVAQEVPQIAKAADLVAEAFRNGGRLIYVGAGTSGRLGVLDASECPPTYNVSPKLVQGVMAGGLKATYQSIEAMEDDEAAGATAMKRKRLSPKDVVAGIAASGRTPFTIGAMRYGRSIGARVLSITCNPTSKMAEMADVSIAPMVGPEVITGSTRMKAGTAEKLVLNMITTSAMIKLGHVYSNLMIQVQMKNAKLRERGRRIIMAASGVDYHTADQTLRQAKGDIKVAIVMLQQSVSREIALGRLKKAHMNLREVLQSQSG
ncbi:MAG: N-acetylmuramic acid 6-phosphate etherase [Acidobacteria bacterium]|nr:MAG: N-acetylmuramic acid 6-phosphate etherase [Acidobacteriota bacterium]